MPNIAGRDHIHRNRSRVPKEVRTGHLEDDPSDLEFESQSTVVTATQIVSDAAFFKNLVSWLTHLLSSRPLEERRTVSKTIQLLSSRPLESLPAFQLTSSTLLLPPCSKFKMPTPSHRCSTCYGQDLNAQAKGTDTRPKVRGHHTKVLEAKIVTLRSS